MNTIVQVNIYRKGPDGNYEFLMLKRKEASADGGFWQPVTGKAMTSAAVAETLRNEIINETGIKHFKHLSDELYTYEWYSNGEKGRDIVFAAEVEPTTTITLNPKKHETFEWLPYEEATQRLKWEGNRESLRRLHKHLESERPEHEIHDVKI